MSINQQICDGNLTDCNVDIFEIRDFVFNSRRFIDRQNKAKEIIKNIMTEHGKATLMEQVGLLAEIELKIKKLQPKERDHVVHALLSFLLGIYLKNSFFKQTLNIKRFQWKLACLFHDVGYPLEMAKDFLNVYSENLNKLIRTPRISFNVIPINFEILHNDINSLDLIQDQINKWELEIDVKNEYSTMLSSDKMCHGMISSLSLLLVIDDMYDDYNHERKYEDVFAPVDEYHMSNWNQKYFDEDVVPACSAIFLHNLPSRCFTGKKIDRNIAPLPFLLKLSDCLQDWERPSDKIKLGYDEANYSLELQEEKILFKVIIPFQGKKIEEEIQSSLIAPDIKIIY